MARCHMAHAELQCGAASSSQPRELAGWVRKPLQLLEPVIARRHWSMSPLTATGTWRRSLLLGHGAAPCHWNMAPLPPTGTWHRSFPLGHGAAPCHWDMAPLPASAGAQLEHGPRRCACRLRWVHAEQRRSSMPRDCGPSHCLAHPVHNESRYNHDPTRIRRSRPTASVQIPPFNSHPSDPTSDPTPRIPPLGSHPAQHFCSASSTPSQPKTSTRSCACCSPFMMALASRSGLDWDGGYRS